jgi:colicin import membrane protein
MRETMSRTLALPELVDAPPANDPYCYGTRMVRQRQDDGSLATLRLPLTIWDVLHPQEGDHIVQSIRHSQEVRYMASVLEARVAEDKHALVLNDTAIHWDIPGLSHHCPDIAVIFNIDRPKDNYPSFFVKGEGVRPYLIIEVVSPLTREGRETDTVTKLVEYHAAQVPFYVIVDREREEAWPTIRGYRYTPLAYAPIPLENLDCLLLEELGLLLCANQNRIMFQDADTGEELGDYTAISQALEAEVAARQRAEEQTRLAQEQARLAQERAQAEEAARQRATEAQRLAEEKARDEAEARRLAEEARQRAEDAQRQGDEARRLAEDKARIEEEARRLAEEARQREEEARLRAEEETRTQSMARLDLERQLRELQARLLDRPDTNPTS